jgi:hypothetical protein
MLPLSNQQGSDPFWISADSAAPYTHAFNQHPIVHLYSLLISSIVCPPGWREAAFNGKHDILFNFPLMWANNEKLTEAKFQLKYKKKQCEILKSERAHHCTTKLLFPPNNSNERSKKNELQETA